MALALLHCDHDHVFHGIQLFDDFLNSIGS